MHTFSSNWLFVILCSYIYIYIYISQPLIIQYHIQIWRMKMTSFSSFQRNQFLKFQKKMGATSSLTLGGAERKASFGFCPKPCVLRQMAYKLKNQWKQSVGWQRSRSVQYSYDLQSYCLNFDDGHSVDHISPPFCWWFWLLIPFFFFFNFLFLILNNFYCIYLVLSCYW